MVEAMCRFCLTRRNISTPSHCRLLSVGVRAWVLRGTNERHPTRLGWCVFGKGCQKLGNPCPLALEVCIIMQHLTPLVRLRLAPQCPRRTHYFPKKEPLGTVDVTWLADGAWWRGSVPRDVVCGCFVVMRVVFRVMISYFQGSLADTLVCDQRVSNHRR